MYPFYDLLECFKRLILHAPASVPSPTANQEPKQMPPSLGCFIQEFSHDDEKNN